MLLSALSAMVEPSFAYVTINPVCSAVLLLHQKAKKHRDFIYIS
jgi:hypothetical protein